MRTVEDYRKQAQHALELAQKARESERSTLLNIAEIWLRLADERAATLRVVGSRKTPTLIVAS